MKKSLSVLFLLVLASAMFCNSGSFSIITDAAYKPYSKPVAVNTDDDVNRVAPLSGFYSGVEARVTGKYNYVIPTPFGTNPLVKGNNVNFSCALEISPVTLASQFGISFTPIAFLNFSTSAKVGTGWEFIGIQGHGNYISSETGFMPYASLNNLYYEYKLSGLFQFDLAAIVPGDWNHVVTMATYDFIYKGVEGANKANPSMWQAVDFFQGWNYYSSIILGYQMPLVLQTVGLQLEMEGLFSDKNVDTIFADYNPTFMRIGINPVFIFKFNEKHSLTTQFSFSSRRGFSSERPENMNTSYDLTSNGREWFFNRLAFSYSIKL